MSKRRPLWRLFYNPLGNSCFAFMLPVLTGAVFALYFGLMGGWLAIPFGFLLAVLLEIPLVARALFVRHLLKKRASGGGSDRGREGR